MKVTRVNPKSCHHKGESFLGLYEMMDAKKQVSKMSSEVLKSEMENSPLFN